MPVKRCVSTQKIVTPTQNLAEAYERLGRYDEATAILDQAVAQNLKSRSDSGTRYEIAFIRGDEAGMQRAMESARGSSFEPIMLLIQGLAQCALGKIQSARQSLRPRSQRGSKRRL